MQVKKEKRWVARYQEKRGVMHLVFQFTDRELRQHEKELDPSSWFHGWALDGAMRDGRKALSLCAGDIDYGKACTEFEKA